MERRYPLRTKDQKKARKVETERRQRLNSARVLALKAWANARTDAEHAKAAEVEDALEKSIRETGDVEAASAALESIRELAERPIRRTA